MNDKIIGNEKNIIFYNDEDGNTKIEVLLENENVWLNTEALAVLFDIDRSGVVRHINNIYKDEELEENATCAKIAQVQTEGTREVKRFYTYYNLDMIISIGFRVNSKKAIKFRTWANKIIKDYMVQGFALNDERFMKAKKSDQEYFKRLLERIKLIRTSERMFYQKNDNYIFFKINKRVYYNNQFKRFIILPKQDDNNDEEIIDNIIEEWSKFVFDL